MTGRRTALTLTELVLYGLTWFRAAEPRGFRAWYTDWPDLPPDREVNGSGP